MINAEPPRGTGTLPSAAAAPPTMREASKVARAAFIGTTIEWFDFYLYASAATLVFPEKFFPGLGPAGGALASFATLTVAFVARPVGGVVFAHYGDRVGRKATLVASLLLMGISTCLVGLIPTYETIGALAPIALVLLRFVQGAAVGGEWGGAVLMATEFAPPSSRARLSSWPQQGVTAGLILSTAVLLLVTTTIPSEAYLAWGWRIPFIGSLLLIVVGLVMRLKVRESPVFAAARQAAQEESNGQLPILEVFRRYTRKTVLASVAYIAVSTTFYVAFVYLLSHATSDLGISKTAALTAILVAACFYSVGIMLSAWIADARGRRPALLIGLIGALVTSVPMLLLVQTGEPILFAAGLSMFSLLVGMSYAPIGVYFAELFPTAIRYSGMTATNQVGSLLGAAIAPFVAAALYQAFGMVAVGIYLIVVTAVSAVAVAILGETRGTEIER
ncbi:MFS transporter [Nocardia sp. NBC_01329]|uniref:MFS transporter n=1 Tax=Nocardia sp. NBC_01329 TaxID=2903594 RepID=UPI002E0E77E5|nr:MHS family MFS transporter [Nocardia sp. NBC_01329]